MKFSLSKGCIAIFLWALALISTLIMTAWNIHNFEKQEERNLSMQAEQVADQLANWLSSLIVRDRLENSTVKNFVAKVMNSSSVYAVKVVDQYGGLLSWQIQGKYNDLEKWDSQFLEGMPRAICPVSVRGRIFGTLEVYIYAENTADFVSSVKIKQIVYAFVVFLFITFCLLVYLLQRGDIRVPPSKFLYKYLPFIYHFCPEPETALEQEDPLEAMITHAQAQQIVNVEAARNHQNDDPAAVNVTLGLFRQVFCHAPEIMARLLVEEKADELLHLATLLEAAAPCIGAESLRQSAAGMRMALESPHAGDLYLAIKRCQFDLENVLQVLAK